MIKAPVCKIIPFSNVDGPGNRMAIFFQGCPFSCWNCHNPETINRCNNCGLCIETCPENALEMRANEVFWLEEKCVSCDQCLKTCPNLSNPKVIYYTTDQLMTRILEVAPFIRGITVSGGEAMMYPEFLTELFGIIQEIPLNGLIDTNGFLSFEAYPKLLSLIDGIMLDVKATDPIFHKLLTGRTNHEVLDNLHYLLSVKKLYEVRIVCLPGYDEQNRITISTVSQIIGDQCRLKLIKYRPYGVTEEGRKILGNETFDEELFLEYKELAISNGAKQVVMV